MKYLEDLYHVIWEDGQLRMPPQDPCEEEKLRVKEETIERFLDFLPGLFVIMMIMMLRLTR